MATETEVKILDLQVNYQQTIDGIAKYNKQIEEAKQQQKDLKEELEKGTLSQEDYNRKMIEQKSIMQELKSGQAALQKSLTNQIKAQKSAEGSLEGLRAALSANTREYDAMSKAERESARGEELQQKINDITEALKGAEEATGRFYRNVGNYEQSVVAAFKDLDDNLEELKKQYEKVAKAEGEDSEAAKKLAKDIKQQEAAINLTKQATDKLMMSMIPFGDKLLPLISGGMQGVAKACGLAAQGIKILGKQMMALLANPIVAGIAAIAAVIALVIQGIKGSEENTNKVSKLLAPLRVLLGAIQSVLEKVCGWILTGIEYAGKLAQLLGRVLQVATSGIPLVGDAIKAANVAVEEGIKLEERAQKLAKDKRALLIEEAKTQREVAELRDKASDATQTYATRIDALRKAIKAEEEIAVERVRIAKEELAVAQEQAKQAPNSAEDNERLAQLEANVYNAERTLYEQRKNLNKQLNTLTEKELAEQKKAAEEREKIAKERADKEVAAVQQAEDEMRKLIKDADEKRLSEINAQYTRELDALRKRLEEEKNLTATARDAINQTILAKEKQQAEEIAKVKREQSERVRAEELQRLENDYAEMLQKVGKDATERTRLELELQQQRAATLQQGEDETAEQFRARQIAAQDAILQAEQNFADAQKAQREKNSKEEAQRIANDYAERMAAAANNSVEQAQIELEQKKQALDAMHQMEDETNEEFRARQLQAQAEYVAAQKKLADTEIAVQQAKRQVVESLAGGFSKALSAMGESNKTFAKLSKVMALGEIAINTGKAIAAGTAQAQSVPYPANLVAIATTIATVLANVATAISTVKSAKFATGAIGIQGAGTGTSDSIVARISNGESVINAAATAMFANELAAMNAIGAAATPQVGGVTMNNAEPSMFGDSLRAAIEDLQIAVSVVDINEGQKRADVIDRLSSVE